jgi:hypothetical protein
VPKAAPACNARHNCASSTPEHLALPTYAAQRPHNSAGSLVACTPPFVLSSTYIMDAVATFTGFKTLNTASSSAAAAAGRPHQHADSPPLIGTAGQQRHEGARGDAAAGGTKQQPAPCGAAELRRITQEYDTEGASMRWMRAACFGDNSHLARACACVSMFIRVAAPTQLMITPPPKKNENDGCTTHRRAAGGAAEPVRHPAAAAVGRGAGAPAADGRARERAAAGAGHASARAGGMGAAAGAG